MADSVKHRNRMLSRIHSSDGVFQKTKNDKKIKTFLVTSHSRRDFQIFFEKKNQPVAQIFFYIINFSIEMVSIHVQRTFRNYLFLIWSTHDCYDGRQ